MTIHAQTTFYIIDSKIKADAISCFHKMSETDNVLAILSTYWSIFSGAEADNSTDDLPF